MNLVRLLLRRDAADASIDRAIAGGLAADRLGVAFISGYHAALDCLVAGVGDGLDDGTPRVSKRRCLAATEKGGAHPRAIETTLADGVLNGEKTFATLASVSEEILVVASRGVVDGRNRLCLVRVHPDAAGLTIEDRPPLPFAPEIPHARLTLANVAVTGDDVFSGDGYSRFLKPFRTIEDVHVLAATIGYLVGASQRHAFPHEFTEGLVALVPSVVAVAAAEPLDPTAHIALAGLFTALRRLLAEHDTVWEKAANGEGERWRRDAALLLVADQARTKRTAAAWDTLGADA